jgi:hypothetical protein
MEMKPNISELQPGDPAYDRCLHRLKEDLGLDDEALEVILSLRNQVTFLQARLRTLEADIKIYETSYRTRMTRHRQVFYEAEWEEMED